MVFPRPISVEEIISAAEEAVPPKFVQKISNVDVVEGNPACFDCQIVGTPQPDVRWYKDGTEITHLADYHIVNRSDGTNSLTIRETFAEDMGQYSVKAVNKAGSNFCEALLTVQDLNDS
ncbi:telokin-like [Anneissia japonica]|uniref:telokin-like n=1 Tax=Anneissia japonica TaxID=1529436 RepID=UPI001425A424|nr:telokin-like [Anneissia japonica]